LIKVAFASLGCSKNLVDTEHMMGALRDAGYIVGVAEADADVIVVNTCCFIESAKEESTATILELAENKKGCCRAIVVTGCMAARYKEELLKEFPDVDIVAAIGSDIVLSVKDALAGVRKFESALNEANTRRIRTTPPYTAYLKISDGCDNHCTYCVIPSLRGKYKSRSIENICHEAKELCDSGVKELIVIAQDTTAYGIDLYGEDALPKLLSELVKLDVHWIRLHYCYPERITDELIDIIAREDKICKYIDMPIQHCNDDILRRMGRKGNSAELITLINKLRTKVEGVFLRTTLIVGFPGESEEQFGELLEFVKKMSFERLGVFEYSQEDGTPAARFEEQISSDLKHKRYDSIMQTQIEIMNQNSEKYMEKIVEVLVEGYDAESNFYIGRSYADSIDIDGQVFFESKRQIAQGEFVYVKLDGFRDYDFWGVEVGK